MDFFFKFKKGKLIAGILNIKGNLCNFKKSTIEALKLRRGNSTLTASVNTTPSFNILIVLWIIIKENTEYFKYSKSKFIEQNPTWKKIFSHSLQNLQCAFMYTMLKTFKFAGFYIPCNKMFTSSTNKLSQYQLFPSFKLHTAIFYE